MATKAATAIGPDDPLLVMSDDDQPAYVSRGGAKLAGALAAFEPLGMQVAGRRCLDAGASTGGFTDVLLRAGAQAVVAVDVGYGQLAWSLRTDERVEVVDRTNVRDLTAGSVGAPVELIVADLSFISLVTVAPVLAGDLAAPGADIVALVKPQFEAGRTEVSRGKGVIRHAGVRRAALERVASAFASQGATIMGAMASPLLGPAGNAEFLLHVRAQSALPGALAAPDTVGAMLDAAVANAPDADPSTVSDPAVDRRQPPVDR